MVDSYHFLVELGVSLSGALGLDSSGNRVYQGLRKEGSREVAWEKKMRKRILRKKFGLSVDCNSIQIVVLCIQTFSEHKFFYPFFEN